MLKSIAALSLLVVSVNATDLLTVTYTATVGDFTVGTVYARAPDFCYPDFHSSSIVITRYERITCNGTTATSVRYASTDSTCSGTPTQTQVVSLPLVAGSATYNCVMDAAGYTGYVVQSRYNASDCSGTGTLCQQESFALGFCNVYAVSVTMSNQTVRSSKYTSSALQYYSDNACSTIISSLTTQNSATCSASPGNHSFCTDGTASHTAYVYTATPTPTPTPTASPTPTPTGNSSTTPTGTATTLSTASVQMSQTVAFSGLDSTTYVDGSDVKKLYQCVYLQCLDASYCVISTGAVAWLSTIGINSAATNSRRSANVLFTTQFSTSLYSTTSALVNAYGTSTSTAAITSNFATKFSAALTSTGWTNISSPGVVVASDASSFVSSSAADLVPSVLTGVAAAVAVVMA